MKLTSETIFKAVQEKWLELDLSLSSIHQIPPEIGLLVNLENLDLSDNRLTELPENIGQLASLKRLNLSGNSLTTLPSTIGQLTNLRHLIISGNELSTLPPEIGGLMLLEDLYVNSNRLFYLPEETYRLRNLKRLYINGNQVRNLSTGIEDLHNLEILDASDNKLTSIPAEIGNLRNLQSLAFTRNQIINFPNEIENLTTLTEFHIQENPLPIPPEITAKTSDPKAIIQYLTMHKNNKSRQLGEVKALIVGQGSVGKTSLVKRILESSFNPSENKTEGIAVTRWHIDKEESENTAETALKVNFWDFGGQEIMHATHQFFLTRRSIYILVLDARLTQEENRVEYWLKIIQSFGGEAPIIVVGNKIDQHPLDIDRTGLQKKYPNIVGILETSAATGAGIEALKAAIAEQANTLPHVRDLLPETWFTVKSKMEEFREYKNFVTQDEFLDLCYANDIKDERSQRTLIGFMHDLGVVLNFQDDPRLETLGILNPQWVTNGVYKILNSHELFQNQGRLGAQMLNKILNLPEYPRSKRLFIVDIMKKFELCYDIESDKSFLIPDLLPKDEPFTGDWDGALAFQYHYNILPTSIISRFIVRMNAYIHKTVWRTGVVLINNENTALVKADIEDRRVYIWVKGDDNTRRDFLSAIRFQLETIHRTLAKLEAKPKVPHPEFPYLILDYEELLEFEKQGIAGFPRKVENIVVTINVQQLLDGVQSSMERRQ